GNFDGPTRVSMLDANDQLKSPEEYADLILNYEEGATLRLRDVASIIDGAENERLAAWANENQAVLLNIQRQPGANVIEVVERIQALLPEVSASMPAGLDVVVLTDRTQTIRAAVTDVQHELMLATILVVMVTFIFLKKLSATIIPSIVVPLSLVGTFAVMHLAGFSLNNLTLMALTIATGFVVDDAIVMLENITRHLEEGETPLNAALKGAKQIGFTLISLTFSLIAVLIPLLFMQDVVGRLFREFAITLAVMALTIATGFVVDDAIVMLENITRHLEEGEAPLNAALKGAKQIGFTLISLTFSLIAVLIPLLFMQDVVGRLFREFAITLAVAILIS